MGKILINNVGGTEWQAHSEERVRDGANPNLSWQFLIDASKHQNEGLSMGILRLPVEESLPLHHHDEQEIYYIIKGKGEILMSGSELKPIAEGDSIYIPNSVVHGLKNTGDTDLIFLWVFPTDSWHQVEYNYLGKQLVPWFYSSGQRMFYGRRKINFEIRLKKSIQIVTKATWISMLCRRRFVRL